MTRTTMLSALAGVALVTVAAAWTTAGALYPAHAAAASDGRLLQLRYEVRREPAYVPPPPSEASRLEVLDPVAATVVEDGVLGAQAGDALRSLQAEDAARTAAALADIRAQDAAAERDVSTVAAEPTASDG